MLNNYEAHNFNFSLLTYCSRNAERLRITINNKRLKIFLKYFLTLLNYPLL